MHLTVMCWYRNLVIFLPSYGHKIEHNTEHLFYGDNDGPLQSSHYWLIGVKP